MNIEMIDQLRVVIAIISLIYASWKDWKTREIPDFIWVIMSIAGAAFLAVEIALTIAIIEKLKMLLLMVAFSIIFAFAIGLLLFYLDFFGGADSKALMALSILMPLSPKLELNMVGNHPFIPVAVFNNSVIMASLMSIVMVIRNLIEKASGEELFKGLESENSWKKILAMITGYKIPATKLKEKQFTYPIEEIEKINGKVIRKLKIRVGASAGEENLMRILEMVEKGEIKDKIWVTPALPMMIFITVGLIIALIIGDIAFVIALALRQAIH
ncbi:MAG: prepilin peptidase [archaeon GB-1867-005]|nr:prepilin peptidase [Candidatus Culexmicrobium cathedralense]